jgi:hypothetical protein
LKTVTDAQHQASVGGKLAHRIHYRRKLCDRSSAQIVSKGEASRDNNGVAVLKVMRIVPEKGYGLPCELLDGPESIVIAIRAGKNKYAEFHGSLTDMLAASETEGKMLLIAPNT